MLNLLYSHYGICSNSKMRLRTITKLIVDAHSRELEHLLWQKWLVDYGRMDSTNFISFEDYMANAFKIVVGNSRLNKDEIIKQAEAIKKAHQESRKTSTN